MTDLESDERMMEKISNSIFRAKESRFREKETYRKTCAANIRFRSNVRRLKEKENNNNYNYKKSEKVSQSSFLNG